VQGLRDRAVNEEGESGIVTITDPRYREWLTEQQREAVERRRRRRDRPRRLAVLETLPMPRVFLRGPRWQKHFNVQRRPIADVHPWSAESRRPGKTLFVYSFLDDVRERVLEQLRHDVYAEWSDPREGLQRLAGGGQDPTAGLGPTAFILQRGGASDGSAPPARPRGRR
jgi:hypothetical protein